MSVRGAHFVHPREGVALPRGVADDESSWNPEGAEHHHQRGADLFAEALLGHEQVVLGRIDSVRQRRDVEGVAGVLGHPLLEVADGVVARGGIGGDLGRQVDHPLRHVGRQLQVPFANGVRNPESPGVGVPEEALCDAGTGTDDRVDSAGPDFDPGPNRPVRHVEHRAVGDVNVGHPVGPEDQVGTGGFQVERLDERIPTQADVARCAGDPFGVWLGDHCRIRITLCPGAAVPRVERLPTPKRRLRGSDSHHQGLVRPTSDAGVQLVGEAEVTERLPAPDSVQRATGDFRVGVSQAGVRQASRFRQRLRRRAERRGKRKGLAGLGCRQSAEHDAGSQHRDRRGRGDCSTCSASRRIRHDRLGHLLVTRTVHEDQRRHQSQRPDSDEGSDRQRYGQRGGDRQHHSR